MLAAPTPSFACSILPATEFVPTGDPATDDLDPPVDDPASESEWPGLGYSVELVEGALPDGLSLTRSPVYAMREGDDAALWFAWIDGEEASQEPIDFVVEVTAVDPAGNVSEPVEVTIIDEGGCATVAAARPASHRCLSR